MTAEGEETNKLNAEDSPSHPVEVQPDGEELPEGTRVVNVGGRRYIIRKDNFDKDDESQQEYSERIYEEFKSRNLQET